jgi:uncharacterized protein YoaH (UPF0181 family)
MVSNGEFIPLNVQRSLGGNVTKLRPGVVRRNRPVESEPDRSMVEGYVPTAPPPPPESEPEPVAAKKKRAKVDDGTREVAVARVDKLVAAGNPSGKAVATVAKELGVSESAVVNWRTKARKAPKAAKKTRKARQAAAAPAPAPAANGSSREALAHDVLTAFAAWLDSGVRKVVRQEIRRMLA